MHMGIVYCTCNINRLYYPSISNPSRPEFRSENTKNMFSFCIISQHGDGAGSCNLCLWRTRARSFFKVHSMVSGEISGLCIDSHAIQTQTQTQNILFNSNNHICKYKVKTETPLGLFVFNSWKIFTIVMQDLWEWQSGVSKSALKKCVR